jgi:hypothetical protein
LRRLYVGVVVFSFLSALLLSPSAQAPSKVLIYKGTGTWTVSGGGIIEVEKVTEDEMILLMWHTYELDGILEGTWFGALQTITIEFDKGRLEGEELVAWIDGTVDGNDAYLTLEDEWTMDLATGYLEGPFEILGGTIGDYENIEGNGRYWGNLGFTGVGEYEVEIYWDVD